MNAKLRFILLLIVIIPASVFGAAPVVVKATPDNGETGVDSALGQIEIVFDQDMMTKGFSICGGGDKFPNIAGNPKWVNNRTLAMRVKLEANKEYQFSINCPSAGNCKSASGVSAVPYPISFVTGSGSSTPFKPTNKFEEKIAKITVGKSSYGDVVKLFGEPESCKWGQEVFDKNDLPDKYIASYPNDFHVLIANKKVRELRFEGASDFSFNGIKIGSSLIEAIKVMGRPGKQVKGKGNDHKDNTLYRNINGQKGFCYYGRRDQGVSCFFTKNKVSAIYLTASGEATEKDIYIISFKGIGNFNPKTRKDLLNAFDNRHADGAKTSYFRTKTEDGKLVGRICVNTKKDAESLIRRLKENRKLELISSTSEPISKEEFEKHKATR